MGNNESNWSGLMCGGMLFNKCEGVTNEQHEKPMYNGIASTLCTVAFYCQLNHCHTRVKQLITSFISKPINNSANLAKISIEHSYQTK